MSQQIEASVTVDGVEYVATLSGSTVTISQSVDPCTGRYDGRAYMVGEGRWDGSSIQDCAANLGDEVYEALDEALGDVSGTKWRIVTLSGRGMPRAVDVDGYDTQLAASAMAEENHDGDYRVEAYTI